MADRSEFMRMVAPVWRRAQAAAQLRGSSAYPNIRGTVYFTQTNRGTLVTVEVSGLPFTRGRCAGRIFGLHIHSGGQCSGKAEDPFADALGHYNPDACEHPYHAGDLPPLFGNHGYGFQVFLTDRFSVGEVIGKTAILHADPDDFQSQPAGNSGMKIACGVIRSRENT